MSSEVIIRKQRIKPPTLKITETSPSTYSASVHQLFKITSNVYISSYEAANNLALLKSEGITHILNLAGEAKCPNLLSGHFTYSSMTMPDSPKIDILFFLYFAMDFILTSIKNKGKILVHCVKGTSRSAAVALAYFMLQGYTEDQAYEILIKAQPDINPNLGFICQLKELKNPSQDSRIFQYSEKYNMFVNARSQSLLKIVVENNSCCLELDASCCELQRDLALKCVRLWEKFNNTQASII